MLARPASATNVFFALLRRVLKKTPNDFDIWNFLFECPFDGFTPFGLAKGNIRDCTCPAHFQVTYNGSKVLAFANLRAVVDCMSVEVVADKATAEFFEHESLTRSGKANNYHEFGWIHRIEPRAAIMRALRQLSATTDGVVKVFRLIGANFRAAGPIGLYSIALACIRGDLVVLD